VGTSADPGSPWREVHSPAPVATLATGDGRRHANFTGPAPTRTRSVSGGWLRRGSCELARWRRPVDSPLAGHNRLERPQTAALQGGQAAFAIIGAVASARWEYHPGATCTASKPIEHRQTAGPVCQSNAQTGHARIELEMQGHAAGHCHGQASGRAGLALAADSHGHQLPVQAAPFSSRVR